MYTLYSDKQNIFECDIQLEGASLSQAFARVILEGKDLNLIFNGEINSDGNCRINLPKLSMLKEGGEMKLEVIADDMYFNPWNSEFDIKKSKNITVEVKQPSDKIIKENKAKVNVKINNDTPVVQKKKVIKPTLKESKFTKQDLKNLLLKLRSQD
jgi:hypothetical protein|tara:strand:- start:3144 stop:3608 length:465 start_codon:yes stop_codon:yes gene_type:complete